MCKKKKVLVAIGTRPEVIKLAPVVRALENRSWAQPVVCVTAQHRQLVDLALRAFDLRVDHDLDIMRVGQTLSDLLARILVAFESIIKQVSPDLVIVQGDTTTCLAASLASFNNRVPVAHVEAGLRTQDLRSPFPEEANRVLVSRLADLHFAPTEQARRNLRREGIDPSRIYVTGNTVVDALEMVGRDVERIPEKRVAETFGEVLSNRLLFSKQPVVLISAHRRESFGEGLEAIAAAVRELALRHHEWTFVFSLHPNPSARRPPMVSLTDLSNVFLVEPLDYVSFIWLMRRSDTILTDSGGLQEEATTLGKPLLIAREVTERTEALDVGAARLVGTNPLRIVTGVEEAVRRPPTAHGARETYGYGNAAELIADALASKFDGATVRSIADFEVA